MITLVSVGIGSGLNPCGGSQPKKVAGSSMRSSRFLIILFSASHTPGLASTSRS